MPVLSLHVIVPRSPLARGAEAKIERLSLHRDHRGRVYDRLMTNHFLNWARDTGHPKAVAWSDKRFNDAHEMYKKMGFTVVGDRVLDDPDNSPEWGFELDLSRGTP